MAILLILTIPASVKRHSSGEDAREDRLAKQQIGVQSAFVASGLQDEGLRKRSVLVHRHSVPVYMALYCPH